MRADAPATSLRAAIEDAAILVTTGAGGVGKTTTAAAIGLAAAAAGRRTLVLTIDPARRLAQAMGLDTLDHELRRIPVEGPGELWASMLDMQSTFDTLIDTHARSAEQATAIKTNRIYRTLSSTLSGTQEYMAMERLYALHLEGDYDLLVIDTPPTRSALDFLDAPQRMSSFLEGKLLRALLKPVMATGRGYLKVVGVGATAFMKIAGRVTGMELLVDLADFFRNFEGMYEGFKQRADATLDLLTQPSSRFVIVTAPEPPPLREAHFFLERLEQQGLHAAGVVVNRMQPEVVGAPSDAVLRAAAQRLEGVDEGNRAAAGGLRLLADVRALADRERQAVDAALYGLHLRALVEVPLLRTDVHDLPTLATIADRLVGRDR